MCNQLQELRCEFVATAERSTSECSTRLTAVVHWRERSKPTNTVRVLERLWPATRVLVRAGKSRDAGDDVSQFITSLDKTTSAVLYPGDGAVPVSQWATPVSGQTTLVVPDGTWGQTRRWMRRDHRLRGLTQLALPTGLPPSVYALRRATPGEGHLCTLEAVAHALAALGQPAVRDYLLTGMSLWQRAALRSRCG